MARYLYIAGKNRWHDYERSTMQIERNLTYIIDTCRFQIRGTRPIEGEEVIVEDSSINMEIIDGPQAVFTGGVPRYEAGKFGQGLAINTYAGEKLTIPTGGIIDPDEGTIDLRIKPNIYSYISIFEMLTSAGWFALEFFQGKTIEWGWGPSVIRTGLDAWEPGEWVRVTMRWSTNKRQMQLLVDGWPVGSASFTPPDSLPAAVSVVREGDVVIDDLRISKTWQEVSPDYFWCFVTAYLPTKTEMVDAPLPVDEHTTLKMDFENNLNTYRGKSERFFAGIIVRVELARTSPDKRIALWQVECNDYAELVDRRLVVEAYENKPAEEIFLDIAAKYCPDFTTGGVCLGAPTVESTGTEFEYKRPSECFKWLCDYCGWHWGISYYKDLRFFSAEELASPAPMALIPGGKFRFGKHSIDKQGLRNRVYVRGGTMLSDPQLVQWKADGVARYWTLPWPPHEIGLEVGEAARTVGIENLHDEAEFDYMMSFAEKYIRCSNHTVTPQEGITMALTARQDIPVITMVENFKSQQALARVQVGDGAYEHIITDDSLTTIAAAEAAGMADLREHANPRVAGNFETEVSGWHPGQLVDIRLPDRGVEGEFLIRRVMISPVWSNPSIWTYRVEYGGRLLGIADYLQALVSAQQKKRHIEPTQSVQKFVYSEDKLGLKDELETATRELPYLCGDEDAICGLVVVSGGKMIMGWQEEIAQSAANDSEELSTLNILQAQGFTATLGMDGVTDLRIHINDGGISKQIDTKWYIYNMNGSVPGNPICIPATILAEEWGGWMTVIIGLTEPLETGKKYAIVGQGQAESGSGVWWGFSIGNPYVDGVMYESYDSGASWSIYASLDFTFKIDTPIYG